MASTINSSQSPPGLVQTSDGTAVLKIQTNNTDALFIDASQNVTVNNDLTISGDLTLTGTINGANALVDTDLGSTVQAYDADTAKYDDATANFSGTLQNGGSNVVVDTDIGSTVQAYDADTAKLDVEQSFTAEQTFTAGAVLENRTKEKITVSANAATGTINFDASTHGVLYYTSNASANWTLNIRGDAGTTCNSIIDVDQSLSVVFLATQGGTAYYQTALQIDGSSVTPKWQGGSAPDAGNANSVDGYAITIFKTSATPTYTVLASLTQFA